ncbi:MAG: GMC family oxidoreductase N-terminal domain-containing protein [Pseudomonadota bacterium]|nr:GMC family oxidoreductase N-terminal domain-containing protein [Pseudomonadota bacterium]
MPSTSPALDFDYVIVGAGTAGCLLANRLSADPTCRVLLVEAGGPDNYHWIHIPVGYLYCIGNPRTDWCYQTESEAGLGGRSLRYPRGRVLGGCSSINGMIYMRGQSRDYDGWAAFTGDPRWRWEHCLPRFLRHEDHWAGEDALHAAPGFDPTGRRAGGEWRVERQRLRWEILEAFAAAAQAGGIPATTDFNRGSNEGVGYFEVNQRAGWRWNAAKAFLHPVRGRANLQVWTHAVVERLHFGTDANGSLRCEGVGLVRQIPGQAREAIGVRAAREVLLCSGAVATPALLERSGVGQGERLSALGIDPVLELPGVGENLQDHLQLRMVYRVSGTSTLNTRAAHWWGKAGIALEYLLRRSGPMSMAPSQMGCFTRSSPGLAWPDLEYHVQPLSLEAFGKPLDGFNAFTASVCHLNPASRGSIHIRSAKADAAPLIQPNYLSTASDRSVAAQALRLTRRIVAQAPLTPFQPEEVRPGPQLQSEQDLQDAAGRIGTTIFHPVGTTRMGPAGDPGRVVDSELRVCGIARLRIVDAGVMPTITSGNTNAPVLMIAEHAAELIRGV